MEQFSELRNDVSFINALEAVKRINSRWINEKLPLAIGIVARTIDGVVKPWFSLVRKSDGAILDDGLNYGDMANSVHIWSYMPGVKKEVVAISEFRQKVRYTTPMNKNGVSSSVVMEEPIFC